MLIDRVRIGGLVVAFLGFSITRFFVAEALIVDETLPFLVAGLLPLVVGLALTVYGVVLAIGPFSTGFVNTVARWHLLGLGAMVAVVGITSIDQYLRSGSFVFGIGEPLLVANVLLGGAVGGTLTGIRSGRIRQQRRELRSAANRALLVNRLLRHEVLNAIAIIGGHADLLDAGRSDPSGSMGPIRGAVHRISSTIEEVGTITSDGSWSERVDVYHVVREEMETIEQEHGVDVGFTVDTDDTVVAADGRLGIVVRELLENAVVHGAGDDVSVGIRGTPHAVELSIADAGSGLSPTHRAVLEDDDFPEFDDPNSGFGLQIVRLIVVQFGGEIRVRGRTDTDTGTGTRITVVLPRREHGEATAAMVGVTFPNLSQAIVGGLLGAIVMGGFYQLATGLLPVIGSLYGIHSPVIGWITHLFHGAVFGLLFAAVIAGPRLESVASGASRFALIGLAWGSVLWFVAAGVIMPAWLILLGLQAEIPTLTFAGFVGHAIWGVVLGLTYWGIGTLDIDDPLGRTR